MKTRKPQKINIILSLDLTSLAKKHNILPIEGYRIFATNTARGRCSYKHKTITVPAWAFTRDPERRPTKEFVIYYLAHECAHSYAYERGQVRGHSGAFMEYFRQLCPEHLQHYELGYKPGYARAAGIRSDGVRRLDDLLTDMMKQQ